VRLLTKSDRNWRLDTGLSLLCLLALNTCAAVRCVAADAEAGGAVRQESIALPSARGPLDNPMKGWCANVGAGSIKQPYSMVYISVPWKTLEPREGDYRFAEWEKADWNLPAARGKRIVIQVDLGDHGSQTGGPEALIGAMGRRYDHNPRVAFVALADGAERKAVVDAYRSAFPDKILLAACPSGYAGKQQWLGYDDELFPSDTDGPGNSTFVSQMRLAGRTNNWMRAAIGADMGPETADKWLGDGFGDMMTAINYGHFSWIGPHNPAMDPSQSSQFVAHCLQMIRLMGYQFQLQLLRTPPSVNRESTLPITLMCSNQGVAPFYYPWQVELALLTSAGRVAQAMPVSVDIRSWLPGQFQFSASPTIHVSPGTYNLAIGIIDPMTGQPDIKFANYLPVKNGWTIMTSIQVGG
jgi:hypothetical protein